MADQEITARRKLPQRLYGRDYHLRFLAERLAPRSGRLIVLRGPSGIGKTALLSVLRKRLRDWGGPDACLLQEVESQAHTLNHLLGQLTGQIIDQNLQKTTAPMLVAIRNAVNQRPHEYIWALLSAAATDVAEKFAPNTKKTLEALVNVAGKAVGDSSPAALAERISRVGQDDVMASFFSLLNLVSKEGVSGCIMIDRLEAGSEAVQDAVLAMSRCMPDGWSLLVAVNDEIPEGLRTLAKIWPPLSYSGAEDLELGPLDVQDLEAWKNDFSGNPGTIDELYDVIENTGGRPLFLADWISGISTEAASKNVVKRLGAYYKQRLSLLSGEARHLLQLISLLPARAVLPFSLIRYIVASDKPFAAFEVVSELEDNNFLKKVDGEGDVYKLNHELISKYVAQQLPQDATKAAAQELLNALVQTAAFKRQEDAFIEISLADLAGLDTDLLSRAIPAAERLVSSGSYAAAIEIYRKGLGAASRSNDSLIAVRARLGISTSLLDTGSYHEALKVLEEVEAEDFPELQALKLLTRGRALIRLNSYGDALSALDDSKELYRDLGKVSGQLEAEKEVNTILRDLGRHEEAASQASGLIEVALREEASLLVQASCYRALARSLALTGEADDALEAAGRALEIARAEKALRAEGNAFLARGEAYRHGRQFDQALEDYRHAAGIAERLANRDSWLWSVLGEADCLLLKGQSREAAIRLDALGVVLKGASKRYPLEYLHWRLSVETIKYLEGGRSSRLLRACANRYSRFGIAWPSIYVDQIVEGEGAILPKKM